MADTLHSRLMDSSNKNMAATLPEKAKDTINSISNTQARVEIKDTETIKAPRNRIMAETISHTSNIHTIGRMSSHHIRITKLVRRQATPLRLDSITNSTEVHRHHRIILRTDNSSNILRTACSSLAARSTISDPNSTSLMPNLTHPDTTASPALTHLEQVNKIVASWEH